VGDDSAATFADRFASEAHDPAQETASEEFTGLIAACMERLDATHREILTMRNVLHLSYEEIAASLGLNVGTVKSRIARARERLRAQLAEVCPEFAVDLPPAGFFLSRERFMPARRSPSRHIHTRSDFRFFLALGIKTTGVRRFLPLVRPGSAARAQTPFFCDTRRRSADPASVAGRFLRREPRGLSVGRGQPHQPDVAEPKQVRPRIGTAEPTYTRRTLTSPGRHFQQF